MNEKHTEGPWLIATSNSWRRIVSNGRGGMQSVCEPIKQNDGHPDLYFANGGADGPDARLLAAAPELLKALQSAASALDVFWEIARADCTDKHLPGVPGILERARAAIAKATTP